MKKIILTLVAIATLTIYSCKKTVVNPAADIPTTVNPTTDNSINNDAAKSNSDMSTWFDNGDPDGVDDVAYGCWGPPANCYPAFVIVHVRNKGISNSSINNVINEISRSNISDMKSVFQENYETLLPIIEENHIKGAISGDYIVSVRGNNPKSRYIKFTNIKTEKIEAVYPIKIED